MTDANDKTEIDLGIRELEAVSMFREMIRID
jgi:hypothetical protein